MAGNLRLGQSVTGRVVTHFYYGVALDVGLGFPAILTKLQFAVPFSENPPLGAEVAARIDEIQTANREVHLTQRETYRERCERLRPKP